jgi:hypothetical protein
VLLFVFWYCHKRGKETRLEKERIASEAASATASDVSDASDLDESEILKADDDDANFEAALNHGDPKAVPLPQSPAEEKKKKP